MTGCLDSSFDTRRADAARRVFLFASLLLGAVLSCGCVATPEKDRAQLRCEIDSAIARAADYLEARQAEDGAWPSSTYGHFRDGRALTPHVLRSLAEAQRDNDAIERGLAFVSAPSAVWWTTTLVSKGASVWQ